MQDRSIDCLQVGTGKCSVLVFAGIHGNEVGTVKLAGYLAHWLEQNISQLHSSVCVIPCLNPDGYAQAQASPDYFHGGRIGRFNANNVDLNRNFPVLSFQSRSVWRHGKNYQETTEVFAGETPGSEPEVQALVSAVKECAPQLIISLHNAGADVTPSNNPVAQKYAQTFAAATGYTVFSQDKWQALKQTGTAKEWCEQQHISYIEIEGSSRWDSDWSRQGPALKKLISSVN